MCNYIYRQQFIEYVCVCVYVFLSNLHLVYWISLYFFLLQDFFKVYVHCALVGRGARGGIIRG